MITKGMYKTSRNYVDDCFEALRCKASKKEIAQAYLQELLNGKLIYMTNTCHWGKEFVKLVKACKEKPIYKNFSTPYEIRGEYSIHRTNHWQEIRMN